MKKHTFSIIIIVAVLVISLFPLFQGKFYAIGDMRDVYIPLETFFKTETLKGNLPSWNPDVALGFPVIASAQIGYFYPPLLLLRLLPIQLYLPFILFSHLFLMGFGTYLFLLKQEKATKESALFGALSFTLGAFIFEHITHLNVILSTSWLPWQLLLMHTLGNKKIIQARHIAMMILAFGIPFFIGHMQFQFMTAGIASIYFIYLRLQKKKNRKQRLQRSITIITLVAAGTVALIAAQLFPTLELIGQSSRSSDKGYSIERANQYSFPIYHLPTTIFPRFFGNDDTYWGKRLELEYGIYIGITPLLIAIYVLCKKQENKMVKFFKVLTVISFLLALGSLSPFRLIGFEPSLWVFSAPARWLFFTTFSLTTLATLGLAQEIYKEKKFRTYIAISTTTIISIILASNIALHFGKNQITNLLTQLLNLNEYNADKIESLWNSAQQNSVSITSPYTLLALIILIALPIVIRHKKATQLILAITIVDLVIIASTTTPTIPWKTILEEPQIIEQLPTSITSKQSRIYSVRDGGDTGAYFTDPESRATTEKREIQRQLLTPMTHAQYGIAGIEWPASLDLQAHEDVLSTLRPEGSYDIVDMRLAEELNIGAILTKNPDSTISITPTTPKPRAELETGTATYTSKSPTHTTITTNTEKESTLIIRDSMYPGWTAYIDNAPTEISTYNHIFRSIQVPAGEHQIDMKYKPKSLQIGIWISIISLITLTFFAIQSKKRVSE